MPQTFDHELALRWKALDDIEKKQKEELESEMRAARIKLMDEMMKALEGKLNSGLFYSRCSQCG